MSVVIVGPTSNALSSSGEHAEAESVDAGCAVRQEGSRGLAVVGDGAQSPALAPSCPAPIALPSAPSPFLCVGQGSADRCPHPRVIDPGFGCYSHSRVSLSSDPQLSVAKQCGAVLSELDGREP